jgi:hypothetical protein
MRAVAAIALLATSTMLAGCGTLPDGRIWGADATWRPGMTRIRDAAANAARDPYVWAPLAGAAVVQIDDWDRRISDWARSHTPVFGSEEDAERWSDDLRDASVLAHWATILATPGGDDAGPWFLAKAKGGLVSAVAVASTVAVTRGLKTTVGRDRPNGEDDESFPSGHTSSSAVHTRLASRNLRWMPIGPATRRTLDVGLAALTVGTSWARIEAGWHFPSDTLFSVALGNFLGSFFNDAFLGSGPDGPDVSLQPLPGGAMLEVRIGF